MNTNVCMCINCVNDAPNYKIVYGRIGLGNLQHCICNLIMLCHVVTGWNYCVVYFFINACLLLALHHLMYCTCVSTVELFICIICRYLNSVLDGGVSRRHEVQSTATSCNPKQPGICQQPWYLLYVLLSHWLHICYFVLYSNRLLSKLL